jgi:S1-C subfamily serine protease
MLDEQTRAGLNVPANVHEALVGQVDLRSAAYQSDLPTGDGVLEINHQAVKDAQDAVIERGKSILPLLELQFAHSRFN